MGTFPILERFIKMKPVTSISATIILTSVVGFVSWGLLNAYSL